MQARPCCSMNGNSGLMRKDTEMLNLLQEMGENRQSEEAQAISVKAVVPTPPQRQRDWQLLKTMTGNIQRT